MKLGHLTLGVSLLFPNVLAGPDRISIRSPPGTEVASPGDGREKNTPRVHSHDHTVSQLNEHADNMKKGDWLGHNVLQRKETANHKIKDWADSLKDLDKWDRNLRHAKWLEARRGDEYVKKLMGPQYEKYKTGRGSGVQAMENAHNAAAKRYRDAFKATHLPMSELRGRAHTWIKPGAPILRDLERLHGTAMIR